MNPEESKLFRYDCPTVNSWPSQWLKRLKLDSDWKEPFTETPEKREDLAFVSAVVVFVDRKL